MVCDSVSNVKFINSEENKLENNKRHNRFLTIIFTIAKTGDVNYKMTALHIRRNKLVSHNTDNSFSLKCSDLNDCTMSTVHLNVSMNIYDAGDGSTIFIAFPITHKFNSSNCPSLSSMPIPIVGNSSINSNDLTVGPSSDKRVDTSDRALAPLYPLIITSSHMAEQKN